MNTFVKAYDARGASDVTTWYLVVTPKDGELINALHRMITLSFQAAFSKNPHLQKSFENKDPSAISRHPIYGGGKWLATITKAVLIDGQTILVNPKGGWCLPEGMITVETIQYGSEDKVEWPPNKIKDREVITISKWGSGNHYYLSSSVGRILDGKHNTWDEAHKEALKYVSADKIKEGPKIFI